MKICVILLFVGNLIFSNTQTSFDDWKCDLMTNSTNLYSLLDKNLQNAFDVIGNSSWMIDHMPFISCFQKGLTEVPKHLDTSVAILDLSQNSITKIRNNDFAAYKSLIAIMIVENCARLTYIIHTVVPLCKSSHLEISSNAFSSLSNLKYLDLSGNLIKNIPANLPHNLLVLNIFFCPLGRLNGSHVKDLTSLKIVILSYSCFGGGSRTFCKENFSIEHFYLLSSNLSYLDLSFNNLTKVPSKLFNNTLLGLDLRGNPIHKITRNDFKNCPNLTHFYLSWTAKYEVVSLKIQPHALIDLNNLKHLDLSGNLLKNWSHHILPNNSQLQAWNLAFNCFKEKIQNPDFLPPLQNLTILDLSSNTYCSSEFYPNRPIVQEMKLGNAFLRFLNLEVLILGTTVQPTYSNLYFDYFISNGVKFDTVDSESLAVLRNLSKLHTIDMALIGIRSLSMEAFDGLTSLRNLNLQYNHIGEPKKLNETKQNAFQKHILESNQLSSRFPSFPISFHHHQQSLKFLMSYTVSKPWLTLSRNAISDLHKYQLKYFPLTTKLDLSYNRINYISADSFQNLTNLIEINLEFNPIRYIDPNVLVRLFYLSSFKLNFTVYQEEFNLRFLQNSPSNFTFQYGDISNNFFRLMESYWKDNITINTVTNLQLSNIHIPTYVLSTNKNIFKPFPSLTQLSIEGGRTTYLLGNKFFYGVSGLKKLSMVDCWLQEFPHEALTALPHLTHLDLSYNEIEKLEDVYFFNISTHLKTLNMSRNFINYIMPHTFEHLMERCSNLTTIDLSFNHITYVGPNVVSRNVLQRLTYFDLRGNVIECDCMLSENFGFLIRSEIKRLKLPGFLPVCSQAVQDYYGGCLTCRDQGFSPSISLFQYSITRYCQELFLTLLSVSSSTFIFLFMALTLLLNSNYTKKILRNIFSLKVIGINQSNRIRDSSKYAFDGFVYYDKEDEVIADWVDFILIPKLEHANSRFRMCVMGKEDWCGATQVEQLLLRMEASRKTIVLLSGKFFESTQCRYVLAVLEEWIYTQGKDKSILITFASHPPNVGTFRTRHERNPGSVLNYSASLNEESSDPMFWEMLSNTLKRTSYL